MPYDYVLFYMIPWKDVCYIGNIYRSIVKYLTNNNGVKIFKPLFNEQLDSVETKSRYNQDDDILRMMGVEPLYYYNEDDSTVATATYEGNDYFNYNYYFDNDY